MDFRCCKCWWYKHPMICSVSTWTTVVNHLAWGCCLTGLAMGLHVSVLLKQGVAMVVIVGCCCLLFKFLLFFPNFWRLRADATCWKMGVNYRTSVSSSAWSLSDSFGFVSWGCIYTWRRRVGWVAHPSLGCECSLPPGWYDILLRFWGSPS